MEVPGGTSEGLHVITVLLSVHVDNRQFFRGMSLLVAESGHGGRVVEADMVSV